MKGAAPKGKQISVSPESIGCLSPPVIGITSLGIAALACNLAVSAQEQKSIQENIFSAQNLRVFSSADANLSQADKMVLVSYNVGVQKVLEGASSLGLVELPGDTTIYQYEGTNQQGKKSNVEFAVSSVLIADKLGNQVVAPEAIISFRNDNVALVPGQTDPSVKSFVLDGSHLTEDVGNTTLVTLKTLAAPGEESRVLAVLLFDKADQGQSLDQLLKDKSKFKELTLCNLVTNECIVAPSSGVNPTLPPDQDMSSNLDFLLLQVTEPLIKVLQSGSSSAPLAEVPPTVGPTAGPTSTAENTAPAEVVTPEQQLTEYIKTDDAKKSIEQFISGMKMVNIEITSDQIKQGITYKETKDIEGNVVYLAFFNLDPDPTKQNEMFEGPHLLAIAIKDKQGKIQWQESTRVLADTLNLRMGIDISNLGYQDGLNPVELNKTKKQFNLALINLYWPNMEKIQGSVDYNSRVDDANYANENKMESIGHMVLWGKDVPAWLTSEKFSREEYVKILQTRVRETIKTMVKSGVYSYIVVNEASSGNDIFMKEIGPEYVDIAFQTARDTEKELKDAGLLKVPLTLIYNDYSNNTLDGARTKKTKTIVDRLKEKGLIDAVGLEMIIDYPENPQEDEIIAAIQYYNLPVIITEGTVNMKKFNGPSADKFRMQAQIWNNIVSAAIKSGVCSKIISFVPVDEMSPWEVEENLDGFSPENDPALYMVVDGKIQAKPSLIAIRQTLLQQLLSLNE